jgi:maltooligosyltrehalose trehalohydrolase
MTIAVPEMNTRSTWELRLGASVGMTRTAFSVWAPAAKSLVLHSGSGSAAGEYTMTLDGEHRGVWTVTVPGVTHGDRYGYRVDGSDPLPDPVSRSQPDGVHGLSEVVDPHRFEWTDQAWKGQSLADFVLYELHVGTFTKEGTFDAVIDRLDDLVSLGVTAIELMPVASFPGRRNWGYDGVDLYAPQHSYGGPEGLRRLVDAAHARGLAVVLDVVYNHVGPEGNYLDKFGPYFTDTYRTPWGRSVNYDGPGSDGVRRWAHDNALYWFVEYHIDALRLDAVHGIYDFGALSFLEELSDAAHAVGRELGRKIQLMAESDLNDPRLVRPPEHGGFGLDAQWADDFHHTLHVCLTGERNGYYMDFAGVATMPDLYREPFFYARRYSKHRDRVHGRSSAGVPRQRFVVASQNHDQVGNRPLAERLSVLVTPERLRLAAALVLLSPYIPLLFMGEEYGETAPFFYFIEHGDPELVKAVREGRKREFAAIEKLETPTDPQAEETFERCKLDWSKRQSVEGEQLLTLYRDLLALRREEPALRPGAVEAMVYGGPDWMTVRRDGVLCAFNTCNHATNIPVPTEAVGSWTLRLSTEAEGYGGSGGVTEHIEPNGEVVDGPRSLLTEEHMRVIRLPARCAAVYVRADT